MNSIPFYVKTQIEDTLKQSTDESVDQSENILEFINTKRNKIRYIESTKIFVYYWKIIKKSFEIIYSKLNTIDYCIKGSIIISHIFWNLFFYSYNIKLTLFLCERAILLFTEYIHMFQKSISKKSNTPLIQIPINYTDITMFILQKTIGLLNLSKFKKKSKYNQYYYSVYKLGISLYRFWNSLSIILYNHLPIFQKLPEFSSQSFPAIVATIIESILPIHLLLLTYQQSPILSYQLYFYNSIFTEFFYNLQYPSIALSNIITNYTISDFFQFIFYYYSNKLTLQLYSIYDLFSKNPSIVSITNQQKKIITKHSFAHSNYNQIYKDTLNHSIQLCYLSMFKFHPKSILPMLVKQQQ